MRVLIDATSVLLQSAGVKNYVYHWIANLRRLAGSDTIRAFPLLDSLGTLTHQGSTLSSVSTVPRLALLYFVNIPGNPALNLLSSNVDIFHVSNQVRNTPTKVKLTATVHDLTCSIMPELHTAANVRADKSFAEKTLRQADGLIAVSQNTRADAIRLLGVNPDRIQVIYSGIDDVFFGVTEGMKTAALEKYRLKRPYILFVGTIEPRKNLDSLLDAYLQLGPSLREEFELVIVGPPGWESSRTLARLRAGDGGVRYLGYVPEEHLAGLTASATLFAYPSLYEGFGFPLAQAMAAGVAAVTSNSSSLPEVAGDGALLVDPRSTAEISTALERLLLSPSLRAQLSRNGICQAQQYRWDICARESLAFFERIAGEC